MLKIDDVARTLGLSTRAVHRRVDALGGRLNGHLKRGSNNELVFDGDALAILRRLETLRKTEGIPIRQAVARITAELDKGSPEPLREAAGNPTRDELVATLREEIHHLCEEVRWLRTRLDALTPALPPPRRRWFARWRH